MPWCGAIKSCVDGGCQLGGGDEVKDVTYGGGTVREMTMPDVGEDDAVRVVTAPVVVAAESAKSLVPADGEGAEPVEPSPETTRPEAEEPKMAGASWERSPPPQARGGDDDSSSSSSDEGADDEDVMAKAKKVAEEVAADVSETSSTPSPGRVKKNLSKMGFRQIIEDDASVSSLQESPPVRRASSLTSLGGGTERRGSGDSVASVLLRQSRRATRKTMSSECFRMPCATWSVNSSARVSASNWMSRS